MIFLLFLESVYDKINTQSGLHQSCHKYKKLIAAFIKTQTLYTFPSVSVHQLLLQTVPMR